MDAAATHPPAPAEKLRILVLTSGTGGGHDMRARAFAEWCHRLYPGCIDVRVEQMLENSSIINRCGVGFYNWIQKNLPALHTVFFWFIELFGRLNSRTVALGRAYCKRVLREYRPHLVLSVHDCLNRGYFQLAREILGGANVRCATYCGEFSGGWGYSRNWAEPSADLYISRTATANDYAVNKHHIPRHRTRVRGHLMSPGEHLGQIDPARRALAQKKHSGLRPGVFTVFLATGRNGANNHLALLPALVKYRDRCQAIIICGRNRGVHDKLVRWRAANPGFNCHIEGYAASVHLLMQASDVIVTRGGTTTCAQALHFCCPIIFNCLDGEMPQEKLTMKYFVKGAGSRVVRDAGDFAAIMDEWMRDPAAYGRYREAFAAARCEEDPARVIDELVALAREAAPGLPPPARADPGAARERPIENREFQAAGRD